MVTDSFRAGGEGVMPLIGHRRLTFDPRTMRRERLDSILADARIDVSEGNPLTIFARLLRLDQYAITQISAAEGAVTWRPSPGIGENRYMFVFIAQGSLSINAGKNRFVAAEEAIMVAFPGRGPIKLSTTSPIEGIAFTFDADAVAPLTLTPESIRVMRPSSSVFLASFHLLRALVSADATEEDIEDTAALRNLLQGAARGLLRAAHAPTGTTMVDAVSAIIAEQHTNPSLDARQIAAQLGVSVSTVYRAYSDQPDSIADRLRDQRTTTAAQVLRNHPGVTLTELCRQSGFGSVSSLRRALRTQSTQRR